MMKRLNIGCGNDARAGYVNLDVNPCKGVDIVHNLNKCPYPFKDGTFDEIIAYSILEHVQDLIKTMAELHRILKPGGKLDIIVPHYNGPLAWGNPTHLRTFSHDTFRFFVKGHAQEKYAEPECLFSKATIRYRFGKGFAVWNWLIEPLANLYPGLYENTPLSVFPLEGLRIVLVK
jgi:SAM-dependent methyltransferase